MFPLFSTCSHIIIDISQKNAHTSIHITIKIDIAHITIRLTASIYG